VKPVLVDSDTISYHLRNHPKVVKHFKEYLDEFERIDFSIISYYEILSDLKYRDARKQLAAFLEFVKCNSMLPITKDSIEFFADIYADLRKKGELIDDIDILIAGIAYLVLVTHKTAHFERIDGLELEDWC
jgi:tRNA(fMet)-specific endonuclease VapC